MHSANRRGSGGFQVDIDVYGVQGHSCLRARNCIVWLIDECGEFTPLVILKRRILQRSTLLEYVLQEDPSLRKE